MNKFTFNNATDGFMKGFIDRYILMGLVNTSPTKYEQKYFESGQDFADYVMPDLQKD